MAAVCLTQMLRLLSGSSDGNPFVRPLQRFLLFTQIASLLVIIGVVVGIIMFKEVEERAPLLSALVFCLLSVLLQLFYYHAAGSASGVKQALGLAFIIVSLVLFVLGALNLLVFSIIYMVATNICWSDDRDADRECEEHGAKVVELVTLLIAVGVALFVVACVIQVVLLVLWSKLMCSSRHKGRKNVLPILNPEDDAVNHLSSKKHASSQERQPLLKPFEQ
ncbi:hypothetical protein QOT17_015862 [Balamuthia mandrillaris]